MNVKELLDKKSTSIAAIAVDQPVREAATVLATQKIGALMVVGSDGNVLGILSERDIVRGVDMYGDRMCSIPVGDLMTRGVIACTPAESIINVMWRMTTCEVRHLPVVDDGAMLGIISIRDVMSAWLRAMDEENSRIPTTVNDPPEIKARVAV